MAKRINKVDISAEIVEFGVQYPDGEVIVVEDDIDASEIIRCNKVISPDADYRMVERRVFVGEWTEPE